MKADFKRVCVMVIMAVASMGDPPVVHAGSESSMEATVAPMPASGKKLIGIKIQQQWQTLLDQVMPLAMAQLLKSNTFYPFAALQYVDGQVNILSAQEARASLPAARALAALREESSRLAGSGRIAAVVYLADAEVTRKDTGLRQMGIRLKLDHMSGQGMEGFLPYLRQNDGSLKLLTPEYRPSRNVTFP